MPSPQTPCRVGGMENEEAVEALARIIADHLDKGSKHQLKPAKNDYALARVIIEKGYRTCTGTAPEQSCPTRLMDGRNEIRCWLTAGHEGDCK